MTRKRIHYTPDDPDKFTLEEMTEKTEYPSLIDMKKKSVIIGANISTTVALFLLVTALAVPPVSASNNDCIDIDCLKQKLERICKEGTAPPYLDCGNILRCIDAGEQEIMRECARGYLLLQLQNETTCNSLTIMYLAKH